jgi:MerR family transcriptional regulator, heat shock protein HspR
MYANTTSAMMKKTGQRLYTIGEAADLLGISVPTIRMYEREGLIVPLRKSSGHRLYAESDLQRIRCIRHSINIDKVSIAGLRQLMSLVPCWQVKNCPDSERSQCTGFLDQQSPCWTGTKKSAECKNTECRSCEVYMNSSDSVQIRQILEQHSIPVAGEMVAK